MMLREMLSKIVGEERLINELKGANYDTLDIVVDELNEMDLRELASKEMSESAAFSVPVSDLVQWYNLYKVGQINA